jgi:hypothetical protein
MAQAAAADASTLCGAWQLVQPLCAAMLPAPITLTCA